MPLCGHSGLRVEGVPPHLDLCAHRPHQGAGRSQGPQGRRAEYQLTANVWARAILEDDFAVKPADIHWIRGGIEEPGRPEKIAVQLPAGVRLDNAPEGATISGLLEKARSTASLRAAPRRRSSSADIPM